MLGCVGGVGCKSACTLSDTPSGSCVGSTLIGNLLPANKTSTI